MNRREFVETERGNDLEVRRLEFGDLRIDDEIGRQRMRRNDRGDVRDENL